MVAQRCEYTVKTTHYTPVLFCFVMEFPRLAWNGMSLQFCWLLKSRECTYGPNGLCWLSRGLSNYDCNISKCVFPVKGYAASFKPPEFHLLQEIRIQWPPWSIGDYGIHGAIKAQCRPTTNRQYNRAPLHSLPAERLRQGISGNLQSFRQHQGSEKMAQKSRIYPIFLIFSASNRLRTRIK